MLSGELEEADVDRAELEPNLAVGKIVFPHPAESLVEAEHFDARPRLQEADAPFTQRLDVAVAERLMLDKFQSGSRGFLRNVPGCPQMLGLAAGG